jgi:hypothetical protein
MNKKINKLKIPQQQQQTKIKKQKNKNPKTEKNINGEKHFLTISIFDLSTPPSHLLFL